MTSVGHGSLGARSGPPSLGDQVVTLSRIPWAQFEALARREGAGVRMAYLDGELEIVSPSRNHEAWKTLLARLLEAYAEERGLAMAGLGSETYRARAQAAGIEPDEPYCFDEEKRLPDLAIEVVVTHGAIDRLEIYRRLGVPEVWLAATEGIRVFRFAPERRAYEEQSTSARLPELDLNELWRIVRRTPPIRQTDAVRAFRKKLRAPARRPGTGARPRRRSR